MPPTLPGWHPSFTLMHFVQESSYRLHLRTKAAEHREEGPLTGSRARERRSGEADTERGAARSIPCEEPPRGHEPKRLQRDHNINIFMCMLLSFFLSLILRR